MAQAVLPDSNFYIGRLKEGLDPFQVLAGFAGAYEFVTCGMVILEVCRGMRDRTLLEALRGSFAIMPFVASNNSIREQATELAWSLDRRGLVLPAPDLIIAACALHANAAVLTADAHFHAIPGLSVLDKLA